jgi:1-acyl-sn-glycerol-3-phosphate acyltransferase
VLHGLHGVAIVLLRFPSLPRRAHGTRALVGGKLLRLLGMRLQVEGAVQGRRQAARGQPRVLAGHPGRARGVPRGALSSPRPRCALAAGRLPGGAGGTLYIERERKRDALRVVHQMRRGAAAGDTVAVFPEGTTGPGHGLLPFHANLLQAAIATAVPVQPVALRYRRPAPAGQPGGAVDRRHHAGADPVAAGHGRRLVAHLRVLPARATAHADRRALAETLRIDIDSALAEIDRRHRPA